MAFADMFAPMRNFGATAAATTQAEAARMGAEASKSRAKTAERLAPWNMAATAVQGVGTLGGLTQKFMEMEQMRPQREAMTDYYKAQADRISGPAAKLQTTVSALTGLRGQDRVRARKDALEGRPFAMRAAQDEYRLRAGARKAPAPGTGAFPLERYGTPTPGPWQAGLAPTAWDWSEVDPAVREFAEHMADTLPEYLALDDDAAIAEAKSIRDNIRKTTVISSDELRKIAETAPGAAEKAAVVNQIAQAISAWTKSGVAFDSKVLAPSVADLFNTLSGTPQFNVNNLPEGVVKTTLQNMEKTRAASLGGRGPQVSYAEAKSLEAGLGGDLSGFPRRADGAPATAEEVAVAAHTGVGSTDAYQRDLAAAASVRANQRAELGGDAGVGAKHLQVALGSPKEQQSVIQASLDEVFKRLPESFANLARDEIKFHPTQGSSREMNLLFADLVRAAHIVTPQDRDDLWRIIINKTTEAMAPGYGPETDVRALVTAKLGTAIEHFKDTELYDQGPGWHWAGGQGTSASSDEGRAMVALLQEVLDSANRPEGAEISNRLSNEGLRNLLSVGAASGPIPEKLQDVLAQKPRWNIDATGATHLDGGTLSEQMESQRQNITKAGLLGLIFPPAHAATPFVEGPIPIPSGGPLDILRAMYEPVKRGLGFGRPRYED